MMVYEYFWVVDIFVVSFLFFMAFSLVSFVVTYGAT